MSAEIEEMIERFCQWLDPPFGELVRQLKGPDASGQGERQDRPVLHARQSLIDGYAAFQRRDSQTCLNFLYTAANLAADGATFPDPAEFPFDGSEVGRGHACMWRGIACALLGNIEQQFIEFDLMSCDAWFGNAVWIFLDSQERILAGRALSEWAEARMAIGDNQTAGLFFNTASAIFISQDEGQRAITCSQRFARQGPANVDSAFFLGRPATHDEVIQLPTVLGGKNSYAMRDFIINS